MKNPNRKHRTFDSIVALADALKTPRATVGGWVRHPAWQWSRRAPWSVEIVGPVRAWARTELRKGRPSRGVGERCELWTDEERQEVIALIEESTGQTYAAVVKEVRDFVWGT